MSRHPEIKELHAELDAAFDVFISKKGIQEHCAQYWELFEEMVESPIEELTQRLISIWENSQERIDHLKDERKKMLQRLHA